MDADDFRVIRDAGRRLALEFGGTTPVERFFRDARLLRLHEGTSEVHRVINDGALLREAGTAHG